MFAPAGPSSVTTRSVFESAAGAGILELRRLFAGIMVRAAAIQGRSQRRERSAFRKALPPACCPRPPRAASAAGSVALRFRQETQDAVLL